MKYHGQCCTEIVGDLQKKNIYSKNLQAKLSQNFGVLRQMVFSVFAS